MNRQRREKLRDAIRLLSGAASIVDAVYDKEQDCLDNYPENLQASERFEHMEDAVDNLADALEKIDEAKASIESVIK